MGMLSSPSNGSLAAHYAKESNTWLTKFNQRRENVDPKAWAHSFEQLHCVNGWALEFEQEQSQMASLGQITSGNMSNIAQYNFHEVEPYACTYFSTKYRDKISEFKFLQFVLKMSHGELIADKNQIKPATGSISADWADEYQAQYHVGPKSWADKFVHEELSQGMDKWANKFAKEHQQHEVDDQWANEFSKLHVQDWAEEFEHQVNERPFGKNSADNWVDAY